MRNFTLRHSWKDYISNEQQRSVDSSVKLQTCSVLTFNASVKEPVQVKWFTMRWPGKWCRQGAFVNGDKAGDGTLGRERGDRHGVRGRRDVVESPRGLLGKCSWMAAFWNAYQWGVLIGQRPCSGLAIRDWLVQKDESLWVIAQVCTSI